MNFNSQDYLAKLLAKEDLQVVHGNFTTASFDVVNRTLRLPLWKDKGKAVYDLLVGHEVGHALYTPVDGWHDADINVKDIPRSYLNIVEDIRIEKLIQRTYPGIVRAFKQGYKVLFDDNLFGTVGKDISEYRFMDRLNIFSKGRGYVKVEFSDEEQALVNKALAVESWVDVINICKELQEFVKDNPERENEPEEEHNEPEEDEDQNDDPTESDSEGPDKSEKEESDSTSNETKAGGEGQPDTETDNEFRKNEESLLEKDSDGRQPLYSRGVSNKDVDRMVVPYKTLYESRIEAGLKVEAMDVADAYTAEQVSVKYEEFVSKSKSLVNQLAKEFERKKAAFEYSRAQTAKKGSLDVNKLYQYQYSEDIFKTVTQLANAKSHGIVSVLDWSGSMSGILSDVVKQTIIIALFCKRVNIPFEFYTFTSGRNNTDKGISDIVEGRLAHISRTKIVEVTNSYLKKRDFNKSLLDLFASSIMSGDWETRRECNISYQNGSRFDQMGSTPLIETMMAMGTIVKRFEARNAIQNVNVMVYTDGQPDYIEISSHYDVNKDMVDYSTKMINFHGKTIKGSTTDEIYENTVKALKEYTNATIMCLFLSNGSSDFSYGYQGINNGYSVYSDMQKERRLFNKKGLYTKANVKGYDEFMIIKVGQKEVHQEFEIKENKNGRDINVKDIKRQFKNFNKSKKQSKLLVNKITDVVAA